PSGGTSTPTPRCGPSGITWCAPSTGPRDRRPRDPRHRRWAPRAGGPPHPPPGPPARGRGPAGPPRPRGRGPPPRPPPTPPLAPNATRILDRLGLLGQVIDVGVRPRRLVLADAVAGGELTALDLTDFPERYGAPYIVLHRSDLLDILLAGCADAGVALEPGANVTDVAENGASVRVTCAGGRSFDGAAAICADGLHSRARRMFSDDEAICSGYVAYRGAVPLEQVARHADLRDVVAWIGPGLHLVQYPLRSGRMYNQVAVFRSDAYLRGEDDWGNPAELEQRFAGCCDHVRESIPLLGRDNRWPMYDRLPIPTWVTGRIALLGDAAHPMLQYLAQGGCQAIEDAAALAAALERHDHGRAPAGPDVEAALRAYQDARVPR